MKAVTMSNVEEPTAMRVDADPRAEGGSRRVTMNARRVLIERRVAGVSMHVGVPARAYAGVALSLHDAPRGRVCRIQLAHRDADLSVVLHESGEDEAIAEWKSWARFFSLPRLIEEHDGTLTQVTGMLGAVTLGAGVAPRRRGSAMTRRRPRFLTRRRCGDVSDAPACFSNEREIISYE